MNNDLIVKITVTVSNSTWFRPGDHNSGMQVVGDEAELTVTLTGALDDQLKAALPALPGSWADAQTQQLVKRVSAAYKQMREDADAAAQAESAKKAEQGELPF